MVGLHNEIDIDKYIENARRSDEDALLNPEQGWAQYKAAHAKAWRRNWGKEYRANNLEKLREYDRMKAREYRAKRKAAKEAEQAAI
jgi:hypothetical protein